jgi:hypothetical protein
VLDTEAVRRIDQQVDRMVQDAADLGDVDRLERAWCAPVAEHRRDREVARRQPERRQDAEHEHVVRVEADLLLGLAQSRGDGVLVVVVGGTAREGDLAGVVAQRRGALGEQQLGAVLAVGEADQDGGRTGVGRGMWEPGRQLLGLHRRGQLRDRFQPVGQRCAGSLELHDVTPRCRRIAAVTSAYERNGVRSVKTILPCSSTKTVWGRPA